MGTEECWEKDPVEAPVVREMYRRMKAAEAMAAGHLTIEGDKASAEQFSQWFKGI